MTGDIPWHVISDKFKKDYILEVLEFKYPDIVVNLEYRVKLSGSGIRVSVDRVKVTRIRSLI